MRSPKVALTWRIAGSVSVELSDISFWDIGKLLPDEEPVPD